MFKPMISCAAVALTVSHGHLLATDMPSHYEEVTVTSSRVEMPLRNVGTSVSVLTATQIESRGHTTVAEILRSLPAIGISNNGGLGKQTTIRIRGEEGFRTKILIDGIDVSDPTGTQAQPQIQHLLSADIERMEVLRGPQGMMYGADAGGVINIITKKADKPFQGGFSTDYGRYNSQQLATNLRGQSGVWDYSLSVSDLSTDGFNTRDDDNTGETDGYDNTTTGLSIGVAITSHFRLQGLIRNVNSDSQFDNCFDAASNRSNICDNQYQQQNYKLDAIYNNAHWEHKLSFALAETERTSITGKTYRSFDVEGDLKQAQYLGTYRFTDTGSIVYGIDNQQDAIKNLVLNTQSERDQLGLYLEWQGNINNTVFYTAGVRNDDNDDFGSFTSYRLTAAYLIPVAGDNKIKLKSAYGTGFRAPSLSEIAYNETTAIETPGAIALPRLDQETSKGYDVGMEFYGDSGVYIEVVYFDQKIDDEILFDLSAFTGYLQENGQSESNGIEFSFEVPVTQTITLHGNYTYNNSQDSVGDQRIRRPEQIANLGVRIAAIDNRLVINTDYQKVSDAIDNIFGVGDIDLDDYAVLDLNISYTITSGLNVYIRGENLLDEDYQEITNFNTSGAAAYTGFRYRF